MHAVNSRAQCWSCAQALLTWHVHIVRFRQREIQGLVIGNRSWPCHVRSRAHKRVVIRCHGIVVLCYSRRARAAECACYIGAALARHLLAVLAACVVRCVACMHACTWIISGRNVRGSQLLQQLAALASEAGLDPIVAFIAIAGVILCCDALLQHLIAVRHVNSR